MPKDDRYRSVTLTKVTHQKLVILARNLQEERGAYTSMEATVRYLLECFERAYGEKKDENSSSEN